MCQNSENKLFSLSRNELCAASLCLYMLIMNKSTKFECTHTNTRMHIYINKYRLYICTLK